MFEEAHISPLAVLSVPVFLLSLTVHEFSHAIIATAGGDDTPRLQGRLTLNPGPHIDLWGTIIIPAIGMLSGVPLLGWAKPVQVNPSRFKTQLWMVWVAIAGPISNMLLAATACLMLKIGFVTVGADIPEPAFALAKLFILINVSLAVFNMLPIPPLDGSRVLFHFVINGRPQLYPIWDTLQRFGIFVLYLIIMATPTSGALTVMMRYLENGLFKIFGLT